MLGSSLSPLAENLIVISLVGVTALIILGILRFALLKSVDAAAEAEVDAEDSTTVNRKKKVTAMMKILNCAVIAITLITLLIFTLFINTGNQNSVAEAVKIPTAPLPADFQAPTKKEIVDSNTESVNKKSAEIEKKATAENDDAMEKGIKLFKKTSNSSPLIDTD